MIRGNEIKEGMKFCTKCGNSILSEQNDVNNMKNSSRDNKRVLTMMLVFALILLVGGVILFTNRKTLDDKTIQTLLGEDKDWNININGMNTPEDIERWDNIVYGHDDREMQRLDVYRPKQAQGEDLPVIISVHGGAWMYGDKERYQYYCMSLAQRGFAVVNFTYRLAPESKFPAQLEDVNLVSMG